MADRTVLAPEVNGPLGQVRPRPIGITAAAMILIVLWSTPFLEGAIASLRCTILLLSEDRLADEQSRQVVIDAARAIERVPELLGLGLHFLLTARVL